MRNWLLVLITWVSSAWVEAANCRSFGNSQVIQIVSGAQLLSDGGGEAGITGIAAGGLRTVNALTNGKFVPSFLQTEDGGGFSGSGRLIDTGQVGSVSTAQSVDLVEPLTPNTESATASNLSTVNLGQVGNTSQTQAVLAQTPEVEGLISRNPAIQQQITTAQTDSIQPAPEVQAAIANATADDFPIGEVNPVSNIAQTRNPLSLTLGDPITALGGLSTLVQETETPETQVQYVFESNAALLDLDQFVGSDYFFDRIDVPGGDHEHSANHQIRLGDAFVETNYVNEQIFRLTGRRRIDDEFTSDHEQMEFLYNNAIDASEDLQLSVGVALTEEQFNNLQSDIVWLVEKEYNGQTVLEPVVYLSQLTADSITASSGASVVADRIDIDAANIFNTGSLYGDSLLRLTADGDIINSGDIASGDTLIATAGRDLITNNRFNGQDVTLAAERDLILEGNNFQTDGSLTLRSGGDLSFESVARDLGNGQIIQEGTSFETGGDLTFDALNLSFSNVDLDAEGDISLYARNNLTITAAEETFHERGGLRGGWYEENVTNWNGSDLNAGGSIILDADNNILIEASNLFADGAVNLIAADVNITSLTATSEYEARQSYKTGSLFKKRVNTHTIDNSSVQIGSVLSGDTVTINSDNDTNITASTIDSINAGSITAGGEVNLLSAENTYDYLNNYSKKGFLSKERSTTAINGVNHTSTTVDTLIGNLSIQSGTDLNVAGSYLAAGGDLSITTIDGNINFSAVENEHHEFSEYEASGFSFFGNSNSSGFTVGIQYQDTYTLDTFDSITSQGSSAVAGGDLIINSGGDASFTAANLGALGDFSLTTAGDLSFYAGREEVSSESIFEQTTFSAGVTVSGGPVTRAAQIVSGAQLLADGGGEAGITGIAAGGLRTVNALTNGEFVPSFLQPEDGIDFGGPGIDDLPDGLTAGTLGGDLASLGIGASLGLNFSSVENRSSSESYTGLANNLWTGGNLTINSGNDLYSEGTQFSADGEIELNAEGSVEFDHIQNTNYFDQYSNSIGFGASFDLINGGLPTVSFNYNNSEATSDIGNALNTAFSAGNGISINAAGEIVRSEGLDWNRQHSDQSGINLSFDLNTVQQLFQNIQSNGGLSLDRSIDGALNSNHNFDPFGLAVEAATDHLLTQLYHGDEYSLSTVWEDAAGAGLRAAGSNFIGHFEPLEDLYGNAGTSPLLKPLLHGLTQGGIGTLFGEEFGTGVGGGLFSSIVGGLAHGNQGEEGTRNFISDDALVDFVSNFGAIGGFAGGGNGYYGAEVGRSVAEYNDQLGSIIDGKFIEDFYELELGSDVVYQFEEGSDAISIGILVEVDGFRKILLNDGVTLIDPTYVNVKIDNIYGTQYVENPFSPYFSNPQGFISDVLRDPEGAFWYNTQVLEETYRPVINELQNAADLQKESYNTHWGWSMWAADLLTGDVVDVPESPEVLNASLQSTASSPGQEIRYVYGDYVDPGFGYYFREFEEHRNHSLQDAPVLEAAIIGGPLLFSSGTASFATGMSSRVSLGQSLLGGGQSLWGGTQNFVSNGINYGWGASAWNTGTTLLNSSRVAGGIQTTLQTPVFTVGRNVLGQGGSVFNVGHATQIYGLSSLAHEGIYGNPSPDTFALGHIGSSLSAQFNGASVPANLFDDVFGNYGSTGGGFVPGQTNTTPVQTLRFTTNSNGNIVPSTTQAGALSGGPSPPVLFEVNPFTGRPSVFSSRQDFESPDGLGSSSSAQNGTGTDIPISTSTRNPSGNVEDSANLARNQPYGDVTPVVNPATSSSWTSTEVLGRKVYQRNDLIDVNRRSSWKDPSTGEWKSGSNVERMSDGLAPIGPDGKSIQLHHMTGTEVQTVTGNRGTVAEVTTTFHQQNTSTLHIQDGTPNPNYTGPRTPDNHHRTVPQYPSFRRDNDGLPTDQDAEFNQYRSDYWKKRANDFTQ